jgi:hypothetical protein
MKLSATIDTSALLAALHRIPDRILEKTRAASRITADNIAREARARVARRTGETAGHITVEPAQSGHGYVVLAGDGRKGTHVPLYLEHGTPTMDARPFFDVSARLEAGSHARRIHDAIVEAIAEEGFGR